MTLILTVSTPYYVIQVSDRLITKLEGKAASNFDTASNKTVVYRALDGLVVIGYSDAAYIDSTPTNNWLAALLWGEATHKSWDDVRPGTMMGRRPVNYGIGKAVRVIKEAIENIPEKHLHGRGLELTIAGWQQSNKHLWPVVIGMERKPKETKVSFSQTRRTRRKGEEFTFHANGYLHEALYSRKHFEPFRAETGNLRLTMEQAETVLATMIREVAAKTTVVGKNLLSVIIPRPGLHPPGCRFLAATEHVLQLSHGNTMPIAFSPWLVGFGILAPPSLQIGMSFIDLGGIGFAIEGAKPTGAIAGFMSSMHRPLPPWLANPA